MEAPASASSAERSSPRRLVLCLDGTWNSTFDEHTRDNGDHVLKPTNVLKLCRAVLPRDPATGQAQIAYYDIGVGSIAQYPGTANKILYKADRLMGGGFGAGFEGNVEDALTFLANNYEDGDEVFVFGFSRGAATARAVTRFLDWSGGLLVKGDAYYLPVLFRGYVASKGAPYDDVVKDIERERGRPLPRLGRRPIAVTFLGVWDTVMALGSRLRATGATTTGSARSFYISEKPDLCVRHARQALAIDEVRYDFRPEIWRGSWDGQDMQQRWFAGVHSNVGGGYLEDGLADLAFYWMWSEAERQGLQLDHDYLKFFKHGFAQDRLYRSESALYRVLDAVRFRSGRGKRSLLGQPTDTNLTIDRSVIWRIAADPKDFEEMRGRPYRPKNVLEFLACVPDLDAYLQSIDLSDPMQRRLPDDVLKELERYRKRCGQVPR